MHLGGRKNTQDSVASRSGDRETQNEDTFTIHAAGGGDREGGTEGGREGIEKETRGGRKEGTKKAGWGKEGDGENRILKIWRKCMMKESRIMKKDEKEKE